MTARQTTFQPSLLSDSVRWGIHQRNDRNTTSSRSHRSSRALATSSTALAAEGVLRYVWEGKFGSMLIEVEAGKAYVNGAAVELADGCLWLSRNLSG